MAFNRKQLERGSTNNGGSEPNTTPIDELAGVSALTREAVEVVVFRTLQRYTEPIFEPLIRRVVKEEIGLAQQKQFASMNESNPANRTSTLVPRKLKLQFRNKISQPALTGKELLGENQKPIELALVDATTEQIVKIGPESTAKLKIVILQAGDDGGDDSLTFEEFQTRIVSEKNGKKRILQGNTCVHLKDGIGFVGKISFTHGAEWAKSGWYRLGAMVVDAAVMAGVEVAWTDAFLMKDRRSVLYEKHYPPSLLDKVYHLEQISVKGAYYRRLRLAEVKTVKDLLTLVYTNPKQLENILELKASSKIWGDIVNHARTSDGMFLYLDPSTERKTGVVLDVKLQLTGLIVESHQYMPVHLLSDKQKVDSQGLVKFASENFELLRSFKDEASLKEFLQSDITFGSLPFTNQIINELPSPFSQATYSSFDIVEGPDNWDNSNSQMGQSEWGKEKVSYYRQDVSFHSFNTPNPENPNEFTERLAHDLTQPGTSSQPVKPPFSAYGHTDSFNNFIQTLDNSIYTPDLNFEECLYHFLNYDSNSPNNEWHSEPANSGNADIVIMAAQTVSVCTTNKAQTRWTKVSKLLRRLSVRERISPQEGAQAQKKQRCF